MHFICIYIYTYLVEQDVKMILQKGDKKIKHGKNQKIIFKKPNHLEKPLF